MVAASTTVERQTFYWVGSNKAMINAGFSQVPAGSTTGYGFSGPWGYQASFGTLFPTTATGDVYWGDKDNWMVQVRGATLTTAKNLTASSTGGFSGGASAGVNLNAITLNNQKGYFWKPATRVPHRGDTVIFKYIPVDHLAGLTFTAPLSPCLFGGRGDSGGNMWIGDLSGSGMTTGNANAIGPIRKIHLDRTYFEMDKVQGKVANSGFFFGIPDFIGGVSADDKHFGGLNLHAQFLDIHGPGVTSYGIPLNNNFTDPHGIYINDVEDCTDVTLNTMNCVVYGGTCNNLIVNSHISTGLTNFHDGSNRIEMLNATTPNTGYVDLKLSTLQTINFQPTLWNSRTIIKDPGGDCDTIVYGPHTSRGVCRVAYYGTSVNTIQIAPTRIMHSLEVSETTPPFVADVDSTEEQSDLFAAAFRKGCALYVGGFTADAVGGFGSNNRIEIDTLKFEGQNNFGDQIGPSVEVADSEDFNAFNNAFAANSGMTIQNINMFDGAFTIGQEHDGGNTFDFGYENQAIAISAGFVGRGAHLDMRHPEDPIFSNVIIGDPSSTDPNRGILVFDGAADSKLSFAPTQLAKIGPPVTGNTGAAATTTERRRSVRRTLPARD